MRYELLGGQKTLVMNPGEYIPGMFSEYHQPFYGTFHRGFGMGTVTGLQVTPAGVIIAVAGLTLLYFLWKK